MMTKNGNAAMVAVLQQELQVVMNKIEVIRPAPPSYPPPPDGEPSDSEPQDIPGPPVKKPNVTYYRGGGSMPMSTDKPPLPLYPPAGHKPTREYLKACVDAGRLVLAADAEVAASGASGSGGASCPPPKTTPVDIEPSDSDSDGVKFDGAAGCAQQAQMVWRCVDCTMGYAQRSVLAYLNPTNEFVEQKDRLVDKAIKQAKGMTEPGWENQYKNMQTVRQVCISCCDPKRGSRPAISRSSASHHRVCR